MPNPDFVADEGWYIAVYEELVANSRIQDRAFKYAESMRAPDDPEISISDVQASRAYLRQCLFNMSQFEAKAKSDEAFAALWGRGALGAAKYRSGAGGPRRKKRVQDRGAGHDD